MNLLLLSNFYPVISYRRVQKESDELLYTRYASASGLKKKSKRHTFKLERARESSQFLLEYLNKTKKEKKRGKTKKRGEKTRTTMELSERRTTRPRYIITRMSGWFGATGDHRAIIVLIHHRREYYASPLSDCAAQPRQQYALYQREPGR